MTYFRLLVKEIRFKVLMWLFILCGLSISIAPVFEDMFQSEAELQSMEMALDNPAMVALIGPIPDAPLTSAVMYAHEMLIFMAIFHGLSGVMIANHVFKKSEDAGHLEYIISAGGTKGMIYGVQVLLGLLIHLLAGVILFGGLSLLNLESFTVEGNLLYAAALALSGLFFYALTMLIGSLAPGSDWTMGVAISLLLGFYLYRAVTDVADMDYSVISPYHWLTRLSPYAENDAAWLLPFSITAVFFAAGWFLFAERDIGSGYIRPSNTRRTRHIGSYARLMWENSKVMTASWLTGLFVIGLSYGSVFGDMNALITENELISGMVDSGELDDPVLHFISLIIIISVLIAVIPGVLIQSRLLREDAAGRLEMMDAGSLNREFSRRKMITAHFVYGAAVSVLALILTVAGMYLMSFNLDDFEVTPADYMLATVNYSAVIVLITGLSIFLIGIAKKMHFLVWLYIGMVFFISYLGTLLEFPDALHYVSPFHHLAEVPAESFESLPVAVIALLGLALAFIGMKAFQKRDLG